jgi:maltose alpha-D-glucosyltransferase/alpha-amylase
MSRKSEDNIPLVDEPHWFKDAIIYELHVRAFYDSDGDGVGDFKGLVEKLDYLQDLGVTAIWLLPFYPSPLRDDGYDIADYCKVNPAYGTLQDFKRFLREAHRRGIRVITELVINHTSDQHPWFQRARKSPPGSKWRNFYVWSDTPDRYNDARIIFQDFERSNWTWDPVAGAYYWHRFYHHQPDLNFDNAEVQKAVLKALDFWMDMGVDGMRLDAVPYLYEREGTNCENLPETHQFLKKLRAHVDGKYKNRMLLAEANQWPEDAAEYFGDGDECHMNFHFPVMPRMFMSVQLENSFPMLDILEQTPSIPDNCQWAVFLRNHDELTLEMVTDEDRDYMYRVFAADPQARVNLGIRRRLAPLLKVRRKIELLNGLLFALPGTPVLYYGDEIGMGDNIYLGDRDGVRTPMQWSPDRNAGFSRANPQKLYLPVIIDPEYHYESLNVEAHQNNPSSLLWWMKRLILLRKQHHVFGRGGIEFLQPDNAKVLAFIRQSDEEEDILCVFNLSRFAQYVELDLRKYDGYVPVELFGHTEFPPIGELPYLLTLGSHGFYWFSLKRPDLEVSELEAGLPVVEAGQNWLGVFKGRAKHSLERALPRYIAERRWFRGKTRKIKSTTVDEVIALPTGNDHARFVLVDVEYVEGSTETYVLPMAFVTGEEATRLEHDRPHSVIARVRVKGGANGLLFDGLASPEWAQLLLSVFGRRKSFAGQKGQVEVTTYRGFRQARGRKDQHLEAHIPTAEQSNTSIVFGDRLFIKVYRQLEPGENPDVEVGRFLTQTAGFPHAPPVVGSLEYRRNGEGTASLALLQQYVHSQGDAWRMTLDLLDSYLEQALARNQETGPPAVPRKGLLQRTGDGPPPESADVIGVYEPMVRLLGKRTAEMHMALASDTEDENFTAEPFSVHYQRSLYQGARVRLRETFQQLRKRIKKLPEPTRTQARTVLEKQSQIDAHLKRIVGTKIEAVRIRTHGDFHLGQVLYTGKDFLIIDFEGEPARSIGERRLKRSPLRDVAGMLRSFHYATVTALRDDRRRPEDVQLLTPWAHCWHAWVCSAYVDAWLKAAGEAKFIPPDRDHLGKLLDFYLLDKCVYELGYELNNRPDWVGIPLNGLAALMEGEG